jgi:hypothetical protein
MEKELNMLIKKWENEGKYLNNPGDDERDRYAGQTYSECAKELKEILTSKQSDSVDDDIMSLCLCPLHFGDCEYCENGKCNSPLI